jgi:predicted nucleotidyltransferase
MNHKHDFSTAKRGPVVQPRPGKTRITIRIDDDVLAWFKEQVHLAGGGSYQSMINQALLEFIETKEVPLEEILRRVIREELQTPDASMKQPGSDTRSRPPSAFPPDSSTSAKIADLCRRWHIQRLALFGSTIRNDHRPDSDIDVLVEFKPGHVPGFGFITIQDELTEIFGRQVDLHTPSTLSKYFRDDVLDHARDLYDAA